MKFKALSAIAACSALFYGSSAVAGRRRSKLRKEMRRECLRR
jgi:hypothetical protein